MGIPWRKIGSIGLGVGKIIGGRYVPGLGKFIHGVELSVPEWKGADKKRKVEMMSDASLDALVLFRKATPEQVAAFKAARSEAIDTYVAARNAQAAAEAAIEEAKQAYAAFDAMIDLFKGDD